MQDQSHDKIKAKISPHLKETTKSEQTQNVNLGEKKTPLWHFYIGLVYSVDLSN